MGGGEERDAKFYLWDYPIPRINGEAKMLEICSLRYAPFMKPLLLPLLAAFALPTFESAFASLPIIFIKDCYDGDTCTTLKGEKIRLACIDTAELKGWNADPIPAKEARDFLNKLVANEKVYIKRITTDKYGRTVGELFKNEVNIQELIVKKGYGKIYKKYAYQCEWSKK